MAIIFTEVPGLAYESTEEADDIRADLEEISRYNDVEGVESEDGEFQFVPPIEWIEITSLRPAKEDEMHKANEKGQVETPLHIRVDTIVAVGA